MNDRIVTEKLRQGGMGHGQACDVIQEGAVRLVWWVETPSLLVFAALETRCHERLLVLLLLCRIGAHGSS